jgi:anti-anti-sigma regulatory factor
VIVEAREDTVRLYGDITENQWLNIKAAANLLLRDHADGIIVDCKRVRNVTQDGAQTFLDAVQHIERHNARIILADLPAGLEATLREVPGLRSRLPIAANLDEARRSLRIGRSEVPAEPSESVILVPVLDARGGQRAADMAARLYKDTGSAIHLAYFLTVPRNLPLNTPMPEEEATAEEALDLAEAVVKKHGLRVYRQVHRTRDPAEGAVQLAERERAKGIVMSRPAGEDSEQHQAVDDVLRRACCEVVIDQAPAES